MIYLGYSEEDKKNIIADYRAEHGITKLVVLYPQSFPLPIDDADAVEYAEIIMYRTFYRLLQEINGDTLIVVNECLRTQNRYDLTYNCIRNFLNQTRHQLVFQYLPQIDTAEDFMILFDFATGSKWKREGFSAELIRQNAVVRVNPQAIAINQICVPTSEKTKGKYASEKEKLFAGLGVGDPHTLPRNLYLVGGADKAAAVDPFKKYVARNKRLKPDNIVTYDNVNEGDGPYTVIEFPHRFIEFGDFVKRANQTQFDVMIADLKIDQWYLERYQQWKERIDATYASLQ